SPVVKYTITFNSNGGSAVENATVNHGEKVIKPADPTKEGYTFAGWFIDTDLQTAYDFETAVTSDLTLYAKWTESSPVVKYTITFNSNGGSAVENATVNHGEKVTKPADPTKEGYTFAGWFIDTDLQTAYDFETAVTSDLTLYAKWTVNTYTITFNSNGGSAVENATVNHGEKVTKPADPTKEGYTFAGWFSDVELQTAYDFETAVTSDLTLYAKWTVNIYTITFNSNGGSAVENATVNHGEKVIKPADPTKEGYTFAGWFIDTDLQTAYDFETAVTSDLTLYAKWTVNTYTITFVVKGKAGAAVAEATVFVGETSVKTDEEGKATFELEKGEYTYKVLASNFKEATGGFTVADEAMEVTVSLEPTGIIQPNSLANVQVYPNPFNEKLILSGVAKVKRITISTITGSIVVDRPHDGSNEVEIQTSELNVGMYVVTLITDNNRISKKVIKK
ncbi:MAG: T9SS type A sorting domain-containing protein, partial [Bacteroidales bacterium]|nr:T9SS type A sorting domain-containing protein [Bacteroidales bacterium]